MTNILIIVVMAEDLHLKYAEELRKEFPDLKIDIVDHVDKAEPFFADAEILIGRGSMLKDDTLGRMPKLKFLHATSTGTDSILSRPTLAPDVIVANTRGIQAIPVSEGVLSHMLALTRDLPFYVTAQAEHRWPRKPMPLLAGSTVGLFGIGSIASELAPKLKAFEMNVIGISSTPREVKGFDRVVSREELPSVIGSFDYFVLHAPLDDSTRDFANAKLFASMKPSAFFINFARGGLVVDEDLVDALKRGVIAGAGVDVYRTEPLPKDHIFWDCPNLFMTSHQGGSNVSYVDLALPAMKTNIRAYLAGKPEEMVNIVRA